MNTRFDDEDVTAIDATAFGRELFNAYTLRRNGPELLFSQRLMVTRRMIRAMLDAEAEFAKPATGVRQ